MTIPIDWYIESIMESLKSRNAALIMMISKFKPRTIQGFGDMRSIKVSVIERMDQPK